MEFVRSTPTSHALERSRPFGFGAGGFPSGGARRGGIRKENSSRNPEGKFFQKPGRKILPGLGESALEETFGLLKKFFGLKPS